MIRAPSLIAALESDGWHVKADGPWHYAAKRIAGRAMPGAFAPDGARVVTLRIDPCGALQRLGAWGEIERQVSLFGRHDPAAAIADALTP